MFKKLVNLKLKFTKNQKGLTLIELLVVIVILGIIAAIAIPMVMSNRDDAVLSTNKQNASILQDAVNRYYTMNGTYPGALENLTKLPSGDNYKGGPYIESVPSVENTKKCTVTTFSYSGVDSGKVSLAEACLPTGSKFVTK